MICTHCKTIHHICPECGGKGSWVKSNKNSIRYGCDCGNEWHENRNGEVITGVKRGPVKENFGQEESRA